jgi:guanylate kinase
MAPRKPGKLVILSGPSGVGKTTVLKQLLRWSPVPLKLSVSATTRPPRPGEVDGVDYCFLTKEEFESHRKRGEFLECFEVFESGHWYGTLLSQVTPSLEAGTWILLEIDVQGALSVMSRYPEAISIFFRPPSIEVLEQRLRGRHTETERSIERRLEHARGELSKADRYRYQVVSDDVDRAVREICDILAQSGDQA